jgi:hypothetical protein
MFYLCNPHIYGIMWPEWLKIMSAQCEGWIGFCNLLKLKTNLNQVESTAHRWVNLNNDGASKDDIVTTYGGSIHWMDGKWLGGFAKKVGN